MQSFTLHDLLAAGWQAVIISHELMGAFAAATIQVVLQPFHDFSIGAMIAAVGGAAILWCNKGWILSGLSHIFHVTNWLRRM